MRALKSPSFAPRAIDLDKTRTLKENNLDCDKVSTYILGEELEKMKQN